MLAGAQLGITLCTLGLGALAEPAVAHLLHPLFELVALPERVGHVIALIIAVAVHRSAARAARRDGAEVVGDQRPRALGAGARAAVPRASRTSSARC